MNTPTRHKGIDPTNSSNLEGKKIRTKYGYLNLSNNPLLPVFKLRIIIRKGVGNAVYRNYIKRIIREYMRIKRSELMRFNDCVFFYQYKTKINYIDLQNELDVKIASLK
jgi:ribonuclease P protein component